MRVCSTFVHATRRPTQSGFGLIELMITVAILAILTAIALPSYRQTIQNNRTTTEASDFVTAIDVARGEATSRTRPVTLCPSANGTSCTGATNWGSPNRWIVFTDYGVRGTVNAPGDVVLRVWNSISDQDALTISSANAVKWVSFDRSGIASTDVAAATSVDFKFRPTSCSATARVQRTVTIQTRGRASVDTTLCN